jgi:hypothetical protein
MNIELHLSAATQANLGQCAAMTEQNIENLVPTKSNRRRPLRLTIGRPGEQLLALIRRALPDTEIVDRPDSYMDHKHLNKWMGARHATIFW